jgi:hypothetical protein
MIDKAELKTDLARINKARFPRARYSDVGLPQRYKGNPLIECLGALQTRDQQFEQLRQLPEYDPASERLLSAEARVHSVAAISDLVQPLPIHFSLSSGISMLIREGYVRRNPFSSRALQRLYKVKEEGAVWSECPRRVAVKPAPALMVTGVSGAGKNVAVESILEGYEQVIWHDSYREAVLDMPQVNFLKLDCSFDASIKGMALGLFAGFDAVLGTKYQEQFEGKGLSIDTMLLHWQQIASTFRLGALWVDEVNCLYSESGSAGKQALNFFLKVSNLTGIPCLFSGTYKAVKLFAASLQNARRICTAGYYDLALAKSAADPVWAKLLLPAVWRYQWVPNPAPLTEKLASVLFALTQAVPAILVLLCRLSQKAAIELGQDTVDEKLIGAVYHEQLVPLHAALAALRSNRRDRLLRFEDLMPPKKLLAELMGTGSRMAEAQTLGYLLDKTGARSPAEQGAAAVKPSPGAAVTGTTDQSKANPLAGGIHAPDPADLRAVATAPDKLAALRQSGAVATV